MDAIVLWRLDRWGRSPVDLVTTLGELEVGFVSLTEVLDLTTPTGRTMSWFLAVFAEFERDILRERVKASIVQARTEGKPHGRPRTISLLREQVENLREAGISKFEIVMPVNGRLLTDDNMSAKRN
ncbi:MAG: recombinase family protein [Rubrobacter sp.]